jgi:hypothetical protein
VIYLNINLRNPWSDRFENVKNWSGQLSKNKFWEGQIIKTNNLFRLELQFTTRQDHAGLGFEVGLLGWELHNTIYDCRHWDYDQNQYCMNGDNR